MPNQHINKVVYGNSTLIDLTSDTVTADKLMQGYTAHDASGAPIVGTATVGGGTGGVTQDANGYLVLDDEGGGPTPPTPTPSGSMDDPIRFFDYDGTLVASYDAVPSSLPSVPTHTGLTKGAWNYTLAQVTTQFNAVGRCDVGANYETSSGKTEIGVEFVDAASLSPYLRFAVNGTVTVDWGDGSQTENVTGTSLTTRKNVQHTYASTGRYTITLEPASSTTYAMYGTSGYPLLHKNVSGTESRRYANCVLSVRLGAGCSVGDYAFQNCYSLTSVTLPDGIDSIGTYAFSDCRSLQRLIIPREVTILGSSWMASNYALSLIIYPLGLTGIRLGSAQNITSLSIPATATSVYFNNAYRLRSVVVPSGVTSIETNAFNNNVSLASATIQHGVESIENTAFGSCYSLASITIPSSVTSIATAFQNCYGLSEVHLKPTTPPALTSTTAFSNVPTTCRFYVPYSADHSILNAYQTATNWSSKASYMVEEEA